MPPCFLVSAVALHRSIPFSLPSFCRGATQLLPSLLGIVTVVTYTCSCNPSAKLLAFFKPFKDHRDEKVQYDEAHTDRIPLNSSEAKAEEAENAAGRRSRDEVDVRKGRATLRGVVYLGERTGRRTWTRTFLQLIWIPTRPSLFRSNSANTWLSTCSSSAKSAWQRSTRKE